jgi:hypothetical protein
MEAIWLTLLISTLQVLIKLTDIQHKDKSILDFESCLRMGIQIMKINHVRNSVICVLTIFGSLSISAAAFAIKDGDKCGILNKIRVVNGIQYECLRNSKGIKVWTRYIPYVAPPSANSKCAKTGVCKPGDIGPGSGIVFFKAAEPFKSPGSACNTAGPGGSSACRYLEAALIDLPGKMDWLNAGPAAGSYRGGNVSDWRLPTIDEVHYLYRKKDLVGSFMNSEYWSQTEYSTGFHIWYVNFSTGGVGRDYKGRYFYVRVVRAF